MTPRAFKHVFGPVPSRRLGRSLGIDLVPFKTCTYDCIYCQLGRTTVKTIERKEYAPVEEILSELDRKLAEGVSSDYVTLSGSGEPTLHSGLGELIAGIKRRTRIPLAVLTNGSLLWDTEVRRGLAEADVVVPSLDAGDESLFQHVNRPHPDLSFEQMVKGLLAFRSEFTGQFWLEVFLLGGMTAVQTEVEKIAGIAREINPDRIQLNTVARPPAEDFALPVPIEELRRLAAALGPRAEVIAEHNETDLPQAEGAADEDVLALLRRRPCTLQDIARGIGLHPTEAAKAVERLLRDNRVSRTTTAEGLFYTARNAVKK